MRAAVIILILVMPCVVYSQAPGYMGRRTVVVADIGLMNAFFQPNSGLHSGFGSFNHREGIELDIVLSRTSSLGFRAELLNTAFNYTGWNKEGAVSPLIPTDTGTYGHGLITGQAFGVNYKLYSRASKGGPAPIGGFVKIAAMLARTVVTPYDRQNKVEYSSNWEFYTPVLLLSYGRQRILWNVLVIRTGIELGIVPEGISPYFNGIDNISDNDPKQELEKFHNARLFSYYAINAKFGIGFLGPFKQKVK